MAMSLRVVYLSSGPYGAAVLEALLARGIRPVGVVTTPPAPRGRGRKPQPTAQATWAHREGLPVWETRKPHDPAVLEELAALSPDVVLVCDYGVILKKAVLDLPRLWPLNVHPSLLPRWRGAAPMERSLQQGDPEVGVTLMVMDEGLDTGPWVLRRGWPHDETRTLGDHWPRFVETGAELVRRALQRLVAGDALAPNPQEGTPTYAAKYTKEELWIPWERSPQEVVYHIHAFSPRPGARTRVDGKLWKLLRVRRIPASFPLEPGRHAVDGDRLVFGTADPDVWLQVLELQVEGKRPMDAATFLRGYRP